MGYKTRSNYAPTYSMTEDRFDKIFRKDKKDEPEREEERERTIDNRPLEKEN